MDFPPSRMVMNPEEERNPDRQGSQKGRKKGRQSKENKTRCQHLSFAASSCPRLQPPRTSGATAFPRLNDTAKMGEMVPARPLRPLAWAYSEMGVVLELSSKVGSPFSQRSASRPQFRVPLFPEFCPNRQGSRSSGVSSTNRSAT